jgi:hypothetical protein
VTGARMCAIDAKTVAIGAARIRNTLGPGFGRGTGVTA